MKFLIVIPALNEEQAVRAIIERCLAARPAIIAQTPVDEVDITVVSDGSSDRTPEIAAEYTDRITLVSYRVNRGYGAAIKLGWSNSDAELVGFLDADGTCDPLFFVDLINKLVGDELNVVLGSRMGEDSEMPKVRRFGNRVFAAIINLIARAKISDSASGMRVVRRESLPRLYPLPDGLHFTPAMSCKAVLDPQLKIGEVPMTYAERLGESKLSALKDGVRFLRIILDIAMTYRPFRVFGVIGIVFLLPALFFGADLVANYFASGHVPDGMIYRVLAVVVLGFAGLLIMGAGMIAEGVVELRNPWIRPHGAFYRLVRRVTQSDAMLTLAGIVLLAALVFVARPAVQYVLTGHIAAHWSQVALAGAMFLLAVQLTVLAGLQRMLATMLATETDDVDPRFDKEQVLGKD
ncbi:MAG: glycosyltransferase family 2 protein [Candidatus Lernaella stagnicola]|nr:glycosyltransferase family 2 protein [Candidatus Lernaella stagnicola]